MSSEMRSVPRSIPFRLKLVLWYGLLVLLTLFLFRLVSAEVVRRALHNDLDQSLHSEAAWLRRVLTVYKSRGATDEDIRAEIDDRSLITPRKTFIEIQTSDATAYYHSQNIDSLALSSIDRSDEAVPETIFLGTGLAVRHLVARDSLYVIHVAHSLTDIDEAIDTILLSFFWLIPLALLLAVGGGYVLVTRFMAPIAALNRYAEQLVSHPLHEDLPTVRVDRMDEMGRLVTTVTGMVERMRTGLKKVLGFASLASHELRTPLAVMRSQLESQLRGRPTPASLRRTLHSTYDDVLRLSRISEDLLSLGTLQSGTFRLEKEETDLNAFLEAFAEDARLLCEPAGIRFILQTGATAAPRIDRGRLIQVLFNLLDNAIRHTPRGGQLTLRMETSSGWVHLDLSDTGPGIAPEVQERVFDAFFRSATDENPGTSGLGLSLVRGIVEAHGGGVTLESAPGTGSIFRIRLPVG